MSRPELTGQADLFYNAKEARKYDSSSRMISVQREITERAMELLKLSPDKPALILDVGCGSGLSGKSLEETKAGHVWIGCDVSRDMLIVAKERMDRKRLACQGQKNQDMEDNDDDDDDVDGMESMEDSDDEDEHSKVASTGDLMHHVS